MCECVHTCAHTQRKEKREKKEKTKDKTRQKGEEGRKGGKSENRETQILTPKRILFLANDPICLLASATFCECMCICGCVCNIPALSAFIYYLWQTFYNLALGFSHMSIVAEWVYTN